MGPEKIDLCGVYFQAFQISWNHLTSATLVGYDFPDIVPFFQHALQMTYCQISRPPLQW